MNWADGLLFTAAILALCTVGVLGGYGLAVLSEHIDPLLALVVFVVSVALVGGLIVAVAT